MIHHGTPMRTTTGNHLKSVSPLRGEIRFPILADARQTEQSHHSLHDHQTRTLTTETRTLTTENLTLTTEH